MSKISLVPNASGTGTLSIASPSTNSDFTLTLPAETGTVLTSGGAIDVNASAPADSVAIDASGNVGVGVTPVSTSLGKSIQLGNQMTLTSYNGNSCYFENNIYYNSGFKYTGNGYGFSMRMTDANLTFSNAPNNTSGAGAAATLTERMRIDSSGNLLVGQSSSNFDSTTLLGNGVGISGNFSNTNGLVVRSTNTTSTQYLVQFVRGTSACGSITSTTTNSTTYATSSDYRLKENIAPMSGALEKVSQLKPCIYTWKTDGSAGQGFIAHELQAVVPECVVGEKDAVTTYTDEEGVEQIRPVYQGVDTSFLVATLTAAIQELSAKNDALEARIAALEAA